MWCAAVRGATSPTPVQRELHCRKDDPSSCPTYRARQIVGRPLPDALSDTLRAADSDKAILRIALRLVERCRTRVTALASLSGNAESRTAESTLLLVIAALRTRAGSPAVIDIAAPLPADVRGVVDDTVTALRGLRSPSGAGEADLVLDWATSMLGSRSGS
jgi:hypothetical protein